uniref:Uncharacterized protein n=1 Tax=Oryza glumipatula TaxID=40148 RepID=A0A0D9Z649_9ORYZ
MARRSISRTSPARSDAECTDHAGMDGTEDPGRWRETGEKWEVRSEHQRQRRENPREAENSPLLSTPLQLPVHAGPRVTHGTGSRELQRPRKKRKGEEEEGRERGETWGVLFNGTKIRLPTDLW